MKTKLKDVDKVLSLINKLYRDKENVEYAHPNFLLNVRLSESNPLFKQQWALGGGTRIPSGQNAKVNINIQPAWDKIEDLGLNLSPVNILIIDKGIDTHEDYAINMLNSNINDSSHGTKVTGIIGAISNNNIGLKGIDIKSKFKIYGANFPEYLDTIDSEYEYIELVEFIEDILSSLRAFPDDEYPKVINMSFNFYYNFYVEALDNLIDDLSEKSLICNSVGNFKDFGESADVRYPAYKRNVLSVSACDHRGYWVAPGDHGWGSCYGRGIDICAPGTSIATTSPDDFSMYVTDFKGTSAAVAFVTGVAALLFAIAPDLTPDEVKDILLDSSSIHDVKVFYDGEEVLRPYKKKKWLGYGLLDAGKAVERLIEDYPNLVSFV